MKKLKINYNMKTILSIGLLFFSIALSAQKKGSYVTNDKLMFMQDSTIKGNAGTASATPSDLSVSQVKGMLGYLSAVDTASLSGRINLKLAIVDTTSLKSMLTLVFAFLPTYADDTAAGVGGLTAGQPYKTATGVIMTKL